jgi:hypothetical protein
MELRSSSLHHMILPYHCCGTTKKTVWRFFDPLRVGKPTSKIPRYWLLRHQHFGTVWSLIPSLNCLELQATFTGTRTLATGVLLVFAKLKKALLVGGFTRLTSVIPLVV